MKMTLTLVELLWSFQGMCRQVFHWLTSGLLCPLQHSVQHKKFIEYLKVIISLRLKFLKTCPFTIMSILRLKDVNGRWIMAHLPPIPFKYLGQTTSIVWQCFQWYLPCKVSLQSFPSGEQFNSYTRSRHPWNFLFHFYWDKNTALVQQIQT